MWPASLLLVAVAAACYAPGITSLPLPCADEPFYVEAAQALLRGAADTNPEHPPLAKLLVALAMRALGDGPLAWRLPSVVSTALLVGLLPLLVRYARILPEGASSWWLFLPPVLVLLDPVTFTSARLAMLDAPLALLYVTAALLFVGALSRQHEPWRVVLASAVAGLALATKWTALTLFPAVALAAAARIRDPRAAEIRWRDVAALFLPAAAVYVAVFLAAGHGLAETARLQWAILGYHTYYYFGTFRSSPADWLLLRKPYWYVHGLDAGALRIIAAVASPVAWIAGALATAAALVLGIMRRAAAPLALALFPLLQFGLFAVARRAGFLFYMAPVVPLYAVALAWALARLASRPLARVSAAAVVASSVAWAAFVHPLLVGAPLTPVRARAFFDGPARLLLVHEAFTPRDALERAQPWPSGCDFIVPPPTRRR